MGKAVDIVVTLAVAIAVLLRNTRTEELENYE